MKVIIAGSRHITPAFNGEKILKFAIKESGFDITEVISGGARGVDTMGEYWAIENNIPFTRFMADWKEYGPAAGPRRNIQMAQYAVPDGGLIAVWDGSSRGTEHMIRCAGAFLLKTYVLNLLDYEGETW